MRLPELPTKFYDLKILQQIGNQIGTTLKIDTVTINRTRERYARLCILASLSKTLSTNILIGTHLQKIQYESSTSLCTLCRKLGQLVLIPPIDEATSHPLLEALNYQIIQCQQRVQKNDIRKKVGQQ